MKTQNEHASKEIGAIRGSGVIKEISAISAHPTPIFMFVPIPIIIFSLVSDFYDKIKIFLKNAKTKIKTCFIRCKG